MFSVYKDTDKLISKSHNSDLFAHHQLLSGAVLEIRTQGIHRTCIR